MENTKATTKINFQPAPNHVLIDPLDKDKKSDMIAVSDPVDKSYKGYVLAIGEAQENDYGIVRKFSFKVGDLVLFSIVGVERTKFEYKGDPRHEFIIAPFSRVLGRLE